MGRCLSSLPWAALVAAGVALPLPALAQDACPPGAWFCEEAEVTAPPDVADAPPEQPAAQPDKAPAEKAAPKGKPQAPPPVVVYQPVPDAPPPQVVIVAPGHTVRKVPPPPKPPKKRAYREKFGLNLRLQGVIMGRHDEADETAGMGGIGLSFRFRPVPAFALDFGTDIIGGTDFNGFQRVETPLSLTGMLYVNPKSKVQFYFQGGINGSVAHVESEEYSPLLAEEGGFEETYSYFGGHGGIGLEFRLSKRVALNIDGLALVRSRTDDGRLPEYVDWDTGRTTNTSGAGLFRGGVTFWW
jgi:hypothetical protein